MNPSPTPTAALTLDPATHAGTQSAIIDALPPRPGASEAEQVAQRQGALALLAMLCPADPVQAVLATRVVVAHYAAMEYFRRAARDDLPPNLHLRILSRAAALCRLMDGTMRELTRRQASPALQLAVLPASVAAPHAQAAPEAARASTSAQPPPAEGRHERRRRERAERHLVAVVQAAGPGTGAHDNAMSQRLHAEVAARAAASAMALAA